MHARILAFLERRPWARWLLYVVLGLGIFAIGAAYLRLQVRPDPVGFQVIGGDLIAPGWPASYRVRARTAHLGTAHPVEVQRIRIEGQAATFSAEGGDPTVTRVEVPKDLDPDRLNAVVTFEVSTPAGPASLAVTSPIARVDAVPAPPPPSPLPATRRTMRLELIPDHGDLVTNLENRVFLRLRALDGRPIPGAMLTVLHGDLPNGQRGLLTDRDGLAAFHLVPRLPNVDLRVEASVGELRETFEETLFTAGRQLRIEGLGPIVKPGLKPVATVRTTRDGVDLHCDLRRGRQHIAAMRVPVDTAREVQLDLPALTAEGRYDLQCYFNILIPGSTFASRAFWVSSTTQLAPMVDDARRAGLLSGPEVVALEGATAEDHPELAAWLAGALSARAADTHILLQTFDAAVADADADWASRKSVALGALVIAILLVLLVGLDLVLSNVLANRRRFRAYEAALAEEGALGDVTLDGVDLAATHSTERLDRTRGWLFVIVVVGTLLANAVGFLLLSGMFRS